MARSLAAVLGRGIAAFPAARSATIGRPLGSSTRMEAATQLLCQIILTLMKISDPQDVKENPVMIHMKGVPDFPCCGFSALAVKVLNCYTVPISTHNILEDPELKNAVKAFSNWPTFPQIFINGEFIGGSDIVLSMHQES